MLVGWLSVEHLVSWLWAVWSSRLADFKAGWMFKVWLDDWFLVGWLAWLRFGWFSSSLVVRLVGWF